MRGALDCGWEGGEAGEGVRVALSGGVGCGGGEREKFIVGMSWKARVGRAGGRAATLLGPGRVLHFVSSGVI